MKMSLNAGAMESIEIDGKKSNKSIYIGNYIKEYASINRTGVSVDGYLKRRKEIENCNLIEIKGATTIFGGLNCLFTDDELTNQKEITAFEKYVIRKNNDSQNKKYIEEFKLIGRFFNSRGKKLINKEEYYKIQDILETFESEQVDCLKYENTKLTEHINSFALFVIYGKQYCYKKIIHEENMEFYITDRQKNEIKNFYATLKNSEGLDITKATIYYNDRGEGEAEAKKKHLDIGSPILIKMLLYEFGKKYYSLVERADQENWENIIDDFPEKTKLGRKEQRDTKYIKTIANVYLNFVDDCKLFQDNASAKDKILLLGRLLTLAGLKHYDIDDCGQIGYIDEKDYYYKRTLFRINRK